MLPPSLIILFLIGVNVTMYGWFQQRFEAMSRHPVITTRIIPRNQYDDVMGIDWTASSS